MLTTSPCYSYLRALTNGRARERGAAQSCSASRNFMLFYFLPSLCPSSPFGGVLSTLTKKKLKHMLPLSGHHTGEAANIAVERSMQMKNYRSTAPVAARRRSSICPLNSCDSGGSLFSTGKSAEMPACRFPGRGFVRKSIAPAPLHRGSHRGCPECRNCTASGVACFFSRPFDRQSPCSMPSPFPPRA